MSAVQPYPLVPKTEAELRPGHFWSIPLSDGRFGCGVVMELDEVRKAPVFHGLLLDWAGSVRPGSADATSVGSYLAKGTCGVKAVTVGDGRIEGLVNVDELQVQLPEELVGAVRGRQEVRRGTTLIRAATNEDVANLKRRGAGSIGTFRAAAEQLLVTTRRLIVMWRPSEVHYGELNELFERFGDVEPLGRLGPIDGDKLFYAVDPVYREIVGEEWYEGEAARYLADGFVPVVFGFAPGSALARSALGAAITQWNGWIDNGVDGILSTNEFLQRYPIEGAWPFAD